MFDAGPKNMTSERHECVLATGDAVDRILQLLWNSREIFPQLGQYVGQRTPDQHTLRSQDYRYLIYYILSCIELRLALYQHQLQ